MRVEELGAGLDTKAVIKLSSQPIENMISEILIPYKEGERTPEVADIEELSREALKKIVHAGQQELHLGNYYIAILSKADIEYLIINNIRKGEIK